MSERVTVADFLCSPLRLVVFDDGADLHAYYWTSRCRSYRVTVQRVNGEMLFSAWHWVSRDEHGGWVLCTKELLPGLVSAANACEVHALAAAGGAGTPPSPEQGTLV